MNDQYCFLRAIEANPEDDAPRLIYADWLDETGDAGNAAMAQLIRTHIGSARRLGRSSSWPKDGRKTLLDYLKDWRKRSHGRYHVDSFDRGFPSPIGMCYGDLRRIGEHLAQYLPLHDLKITSIDHNPTERCPLLRSVKRLSFSRYDGCSDNTIRLLQINAEFLVNLTHLDLGRCFVSVQRAEILAALRFPNLVGFFPTGCSAKSARVLKDAPFAKQLKRFAIEWLSTSGGER